MKNHRIQLLMIACTLLLSVFGIKAQAVDDATVVSISNPTHSNGVHIGDVLKRSITLDVKAPYQISKNSYPVKGSSQNGMELVDVELKTTKNGQVVRYRLDLAYQVFAHSRAPAVMQLPAEKLVMTGGPKSLAINIPAWGFWFSPLVDGNLVTAKANIQPQQKPPLVSISFHQSLLIGFAGLLVLSLIAALYINADRRWLPFMGGAFALAYRRIKRLPGKEEQRALLYLHEAFSQVHGCNLFARDIEPFLAAHPNYARMRAEILAFFEQSNQVLFGSRSHDSGTLMSNLLVLSKGLRDCERGLR